MAGNSAPRHRAKKSLGQNFLVDPNLQKKIAESISPSPLDEVLEIGPGMGALTEHLAGRVARLVLVELDDELAPRLREQYASDSTVEIVHDDVLNTDLATLFENPQSIKVIGNIPYNITTPILFHLLSANPRPAQIVLMVQREVADRILAVPGNRTYGALAVGVQAVADVERVLHVSRQAFRPVPDVESSVIRVTPHAPPRMSPSSEVALRTLTRLAFGQRRKQFQKILRGQLNLAPAELGQITSKTGFDLSHRPEVFSPNEFCHLADALVAAGFLSSEKA